MQRRMRLLAVTFLMECCHHAPTIDSSMESRDDAVAHAREMLLDASDFTEEYSDDYYLADGTYAPIIVTRRNFIDALVVRYHDELSASGAPTEIQTQVQRTIAVRRLWLDWNPIGYSEGDLLRILGAPQRRIDNASKNEAVWVYDFLTAFSRSYSYSFKIHGGRVEEMAIQASTR